MKMGGLHRALRGQVRSHVDPGRTNDLRHAKKARSRLKNQAIDRANTHIHSLRSEALPPGPVGANLFARRHARYTQNPPRQQVGSYRKCQQFTQKRGFTARPCRSELVREASRQIHRKTRLANKLAPTENASNSLRSEALPLSSPACSAASASRRHAGGCRRSGTVRAIWPADLDRFPDPARRRG